MCLVKVKEEAEYDVPYRVSTRHRGGYDSPPRRRSTRISRTIVEQRAPSVSHTRISRVSIPAPAPYPIPAPQPVPVFVEPPPPPPPPPPPSLPRAPSPAHAHYVEVSPRSSRVSSADSASVSDYVIREREVRRERERREYSPARSERYSYERRASPAYESFRYIKPPPEERYVARERSRSRDERRYPEDPRESRQSYRSTRITVDQGGGRRRDYHR